MNQAETKMSTDHDHPISSPPSFKLDSIAKKLHIFFDCISVPFLFPSVPFSILHSPVPPFPLSLFPSFLALSLSRVAISLLACSGLLPCASTFSSPRSPALCFICDDRCFDSTSFFLPPASRSRLASTSSHLAVYTSTSSVCLLLFAIVQKSYLPKHMQEPSHAKVLLTERLKPSKNSWSAQPCSSAAALRDPKVAAFTLQQTEAIVSATVRPPVALVTKDGLLSVRKPSQNYGPE